MSDGGGDSGGGDSGGGGKGGGSSSDSGGFSGGGDTASYGGYTPPEGSVTPTEFASNYSSGGTSSSGSVDSFTSPGEQAGFQGSGNLPSEITTGSSSGASDYSAPSLSDFLSGPTGGDGGFNLSGPGPVGGGIGAPTASGGVFSTDGGSGASLPQDTNALGTTAPSAGGGTSALAFAAPSGVSGTPQLDSLVTDPNGNSGSTTPSDQNIFDSLNGAQTATANQYADTASGGVPSATSGSTTLPATTPSSGGGGSGNSQTTGMIPGVSNNTLGVAAAGAGLLNNLINGNKSVPAVAPLNAQAAKSSATSDALLAKGDAQGAQFGTPALQSGQDQTAKGAALQQYVATGQLPQGYEDQIQQAAQAAKSSIISNYANRGLPTDPSQNSALAQELSQVDARLPAAREQLAQSLATTGNSIVASGNQTSATGNALTSNGLISDGLQSAGISSGIYQTLANLQNSQNTARGQAIANFASSLNGGNKGVTVNLGKAA